MHFTYGMQKIKKHISILLFTINTVIIMREGDSHKSSYINKKKVMLRIWFELLFDDNFMFSFILWIALCEKQAFACNVRMFHEVWVITETLAALTDRRDMTLSNKWWQWRKINQPNTHHVQWPLTCVRHGFHFSSCIWHLRAL